MTLGHILFNTTMVLSAAYAVLLAWCIYGWLRLRKTEAFSGFPASNIYISVIIPARNEEASIRQCLSDFLIQDYARGSFELIVADDHSTDSTPEIVKKFISENPSLRIQLLTMQDHGKSILYKKQAITEAIAISKGALIVTTDADCRRGPQWLSTLANYYKIHGPEMMSAPVIFEGEKNWLEKIQSLEFLGLIAIGAAAIKNNKPFLCNGANLAFTKEAFNNTGGYSGARNISSGDDTQLMFKIAAKGKEKIHFVKSPEATVTTHAQHSLKALLHQRKRWASKIPFQMNAFTVFFAAIAYLLHAGLLVSGVWVFCSGNTREFLIPFIIKLIPEFVLLMSVTVFFKKSNLLYLFLPAQLLYPVYISVVGLASLSGSYQWKGRTVK